MEIAAVLKKEMLLIKRTYKSMLFLVLIPIVIVSVNLIYRNNFINNLKIGVVGDKSVEINNILNNDSDYIKYQVLKFDNLDKANNALNKGTIQAYIYIKGKQLTINTIGKEGLAFTDVLIKEFQQYTSDMIKSKSPELFNKIISAQPFNVNINNMPIGAKDNKIDSNFLSIGLVWICVYMPLNFASNQIFEEKINKTIYLLIKSGMNLTSILLGKLIAAFIVIISVLCIFMIYSMIILKTSFKLNTVFIIFIVILNSLFFSYLISILCKNIRVNSFIIMIIVLPSILFSGLTIQYKGVLDYIIKIFPAFHSVKLLKLSLNGYNIPYFSIIYVIGTGIIFGILSIAALKKVSKNMIVFRQHQI